MREERAYEREGNIASFLVRFNPVDPSSFLVHLSPISVSDQLNNNMTVADTPLSLVRQSLIRDNS